MAVAARFMSTSPYPFSKTAMVVPESSVPHPKNVLKGKGLMSYLHQSLSTPEKRKLLSTLFSRRHPDQLLPGSILSVSLTHAPSSFSGVLLSIRRRGVDTSFTLRNVFQRTGVEMRFFVNSPHVQDITVVRRAGGKDGRRMRRAKLFYLRDSPEKFSMISAGTGAKRW